MKPALRRIKAGNSRDVLNQIFGALPDLLFEKLHRVSGCGAVMHQDLPMNQFNLNNVRSIEITDLTACAIEEQHPLNVLPTCSGYYYVETCDASPYYKIPTHPVGVGAVDVFFDGYKLIADVDYIEIDENHVRILQSAPAGTLIEFVIYSSLKCSVEDVPDCNREPGQPPVIPPTYTYYYMTSTPYPIYGIESIDDPLAMVEAFTYEARIPSLDNDPIAPQSGELRNIVHLHTVYDPNSLDNDTLVPQSGTLEVIVHLHTVYDPNSLDNDTLVPQSGTLEVIVIQHDVYDDATLDNDTLQLLSGSLT